MILLALLLAAQTSSADIVVNGKRLDDAAAACARRQCTPLRDAQVAVTLAERQFRGGDYLSAKRTLAAAIAREKDHAATDPKPVAALYEAYATVAIHDGDEDVYRKAVFNEVRTLRDNLPADDPAVLGAAFAKGDMWVKLGKYYNADQAYATVAQRATAEGQTRVAALATMRRIGLVIAQHHDAQAAAMLEKLERQDGADSSLRPVLNVLRLRLAAHEGNQTRIDALVRDIGHAGGAVPVLVWAPPYQPTGTAAAEDSARMFDYYDPMSARSTDTDPYLWADIGFWIKPDGHTDEVTVLRQTPNGGWTKPFLNQIARRRYTATADANGPGVYRVERFTLRGSYTTPTGSLVQRRAGPAHIEVLDLTRPGATASTDMPATMPASSSAKS